MFAAGRVSKLGEHGNQPGKVRLHRAALEYGLPSAPLDETARMAALKVARAEAAEIFAASDEELDLVVPPLEVLLP